MGYRVSDWDTARNSGDSALLDTERLRVSLTKNGYLKIAEIVEHHPSHEVLDHVSGSHSGVNLVRSQVANILSADPSTDVVPAFWDEIRRHDRATIRAFTFLAIVLSHYDLISVFANAGGGDCEGTLSRDDLTEKVYTNLVFAMAQVDACTYQRGTEQIHYNLEPVTRQLANVGPLVERLVRAKLRRCGWRDPDEYTVAGDGTLLEESSRLNIDRALGMTRQQFATWLTSRPRQPR